MKKAVSFLSSSVIYRVVNVATEEFIREGQGYARKVVQNRKRYRQANDRQCWDYEQGLAFIEEVVKLSGGSASE